ncbi:MAG: 4-hydroxy-tetrahydrodipicolinate reductase, partial [Bacteroidia bacterium]
MKIALLGYGKMGKAVEKIAIAKGHQIVYKVNMGNAYDFIAMSLRNVDVAIDFSMPHAAVDNILKCFQAKVPIVVGTTGWYEQFDFIRDKCLNEEHTMVYSTNFSVGVNIFFKLNKLLAKIMDSYPDYDVRIEETHHTEKKDYPSGTALTMAKQILAENHHKTTHKGRLVMHEHLPNQSVKPHELLIESKRFANVIGDHIVIYESVIDEIQLVHKAKSRYGYAKGAVLAAEWIQGKKGIFTMDDIL